MATDQVMSGTETSSDDFSQQKSSAFMAWLGKLHGVEISENIELRDLPYSGATRGVCMCIMTFEYLRIL